MERGCTGPLHLHLFQLQMLPGAGNHRAATFPLEAEAVGIQFGYMQLWGHRTALPHV